MASPLPASASDSGTTADATARLQAAVTQVHAKLAQAASALAAGGESWNPPHLPLRPFVAGQMVAPEYRVFRHDQLGLHLVLRDVTEFPRHTCVFGPVRADGTPVTFAEAVKYAHRGFAAWSREHLLPNLAAAAAPAGEDVAEAAERLVKIYSTPPPGG